MNKRQLKDPLQEIMERHLIRSSTEDEPSTKMIQAVIDDYLRYLLSQGVNVPAQMKEVLVADLREEIRELIIKRTSGSVSLPRDRSEELPPRRLNVRKLV